MANNHVESYKTGNPRKFRTKLTWISCFVRFRFILFNVYLHGRMSSETLNKEQIHPKELHLQH